jgi:hypothetical protein
VPIVGLFDAPLGRAPWLLAGLLVTGTIGLASVGTLFAAMLVRVHSRDVLLPVLLYPIAVPVVIAGAVGTAAIFSPEPNLALARAWLAMLVFFDAVFVTLALWTFGPVASSSEPPRAARVMRILNRLVRRPSRRRGDVRARAVHDRRRPLRSTMGLIRRFSTSTCPRR